MALVEELRHGIVTTNVQPHLADVDLLRVPILIVAQAMQRGGDERLDHEHAAEGLQRMKAAHRPLPI